MKTIILGLDFNIANVSHLNKMTPTEQIAYLKTGIKNVYDIAVKKHPDCHIILAWREFGINGMAKGRLSLSETERRQFMIDIQEESNHANFTIVAGPVSAVKQKIETTKISERYQLHNYLKQSDFDKQYENHAKKLNNLSKIPFNQVRNTSYVFSEGKKIDKRDKITPYDETKYSGVLNSVFKPGKELSLITVKNQKILIEICREHGLLETNLFADIHFVLSATITTYPSKIRGRIMVHLDSDHPIGVYLKNPTDIDNFVVYDVDILSDKDNPVFQEVNATHIDIFSIIKAGMKDGLTALLRDKKRAKALLNETSDDMSPLMVAIKMGNGEFVELIVNCEAFEPQMLTAKEPLMGNTPLMMAILNQRLGCILAMLSCKAMTVDVLKITNDYGADAIKYIIESPAYMIKEFLDNPIFQSLGWANLLRRAIAVNQKEDLFFKKILSHEDFDPNALMKQDRKGNNVLQSTIATSKLKFSIVLLDSQHSSTKLLTQQNDKGRNTLHTAIEYGDSLIVSQLLQSRHATSELFTQLDKKGLNVMHFALKQEEVEIFETLLESEFSSLEPLRQINDSKRNIPQELISRGDVKLVCRLINPLYKSELWLATEGTHNHALGMLMDLLPLPKYSIAVKAIINARICDKPMIDFIKAHPKLVYLDDDLIASLDKQLPQSRSLASFFNRSADIGFALQHCSEKMLPT